MSEEQQVETQEQVDEQLTMSLIQAVEHLQQHEGCVEVSDSAPVEVSESAPVQVEVSDSAPVRVKVSDSEPMQMEVSDSAQVVSDSAQVKVVSDSAPVQLVVSDSAPVQTTVQVEASGETQGVQHVYVQENNVVEVQEHIEIEENREGAPDQRQEYGDRNDAVEALVQIESGIVHVQPNFVEGIVEGVVEVNSEDQTHVQVGSSRDAASDQSGYVESNGVIQAQAHVQIETSKEDRSGSYAQDQPGSYVQSDASTVPMEIHVQVEDDSQPGSTHQLAVATHDYEESPHAQAHVQVRSEEHHPGYGENEGDELEMDEAELEAQVDISIGEFIQGLNDNLREAVELIRKGTHLHKAAKIARVPFLELEMAVKELKNRGDLRIEKCRKTVKVKLKEEDEEAVPLTKKKRQFIDWNYTAEDVQAAADAVKDGEYTVKAAHRAFKVPERAINRALKGEKVEGRVCTPGRIRLRKRGKLTEEEEKVIVEYSLALHRLHHPVTIKAVFPLAKQLLALRDETIKDEHGWWEAFVKRHQELASFWITNREFSPNLANRISWTKQYFERIVSVFEVHNFFAKPSRIYACEVFQFEIEQWEKKVAKIVQVEILVAANAVGYHVLPPCVVYASEGEEIPDFMGLPEAGFVSSEDKKVSTAILVEWFRSVFLHYLPARSQEDPLVLLLRGKNEWLTPELITLAEQQHVHLVPIPIICLNYLSPLLPLMYNLKDAYKKKLHEYKQTNLLSQVRKPKDETFYPVTLRKLFSSTFSMYEIQEAFKDTGVFPLKPDEVDVSEESAIEAKWENNKEAIEDIKKKRMLGIALGKRTPGFRKYSDMVFTDLDSPKPPPVVQPQPFTVQNHIQVPLPGGGFMLYPQQPLIQSGSQLLNLAPSTALIGGRPALVNLSNLQPLVTSAASIVPVGSAASSSAQATAATTSTATTSSTTSADGAEKATGESGVKFVKLTKGVGEETTTSILNDSNAASSKTVKDVESESKEDESTQKSAKKLPKEIPKKTDKNPQKKPTQETDSSDDAFPIKISKAASVDSKDGEPDEQTVGPTRRSARKAVSDTTKPSTVSTRRSTRTSESSATTNDETVDQADTATSSKSSDVTESDKPTSESIGKKSNKRGPKGKSSKKVTTKKATSGGTGVRNFTQNVGSKYLFSPTVKTPENTSKDDGDVSDDLASFDSEAEDDNVTKKPQEDVTKEKPPPPPPAPKVSLKSDVPSSVLDRIEAMISGNDALLTSLTTKEVKARERPPTQPTPKTVPSVVDPTESIESRLSKAFSADVLNSVMAVKQDLAKRPPLLYQDPPTTTVGPLVQVIGGSTLVTLPKTTTGGPIVLPTGTLYPVHQTPMITKCVPASALAPTATSIAATAISASATSVSSPATSVSSPATSVSSPATSVSSPATSKSPVTKDKTDETNTKKGNATQRGQSSRLRKSSQQADEIELEVDIVEKEANSDPDFVVSISEQPDATPVRKSSRKPKPKTMFDPEDSTVTKESLSPSGDDKLEGSRKRKASLVKRQYEGTPESPKKSKVELGNVLSGRSTRSASKDMGRSVRTRSLKK